MRADTRPNPFASHAYYVNNVYRQRVHDAMSASWVDQTSKATLNRISNVGSAFWIDRISKVRGEGITLELVLSEAAAASDPPLVVAILYNLPNRDCHALASMGELCCQYAPDGTCVFEAADKTCHEGLARYKHEYVDAFADLLGQHSAVPAAIIIEPDSLANLATNTADANCGNPASQAAYLQGIKYAVETLHRRAPHAALYLDAGHGGWLGWPDKADDYVSAVGRLGEAASYLRGFATNVANYQSLGKPCPASAFGEDWTQLGQQYCAAHRQDECCDDPCNLFHDYNSGNNEHNYVQLLAARLARSSVRSKIPEPKFVIDTGRNGRGEMREDCANWCNIRGAGIGHAPTSHTQLPAIVDAYFWLKTPGESDGCTETLPDGGRCPRYDGMCGSVDSVGSADGEPRVPEAGEWYVPSFAELICRARLDGQNGDTASGSIEDERCQDTLLASIRVTEEVLATVSSLPPPPKYNWRRPPLGRGVDISQDGQVLPSATPVAGCTVDEPSRVGSVLSIALVVAFALWFVFPRVEPRLRRRLGAARYAAYVQDLGRAAAAAESRIRWAALFAFQFALRLIEVIKRARMSGIEIYGDDWAVALPTADPGEGKVEDMPMEFGNVEFADTSCECEVDVDDAQYVASEASEEIILA